MSSKRKKVNLFKAATTVVGVALMGAAFAPGAKADDWDKKTTITFSNPVEIPGVHLEGWGVLPAGTYVFKLLDSKSDRHIVQIFNQDETKVYATILAIPNYRLTPTDKTVMTFNEGIAGRPEAIRAWFYPGANWGEEFVYPKAKAVELAQIAKVPVLALKADVPLEAAQPEHPQVVAQLAQAPIVAVKPTGEVVEVAQVIQTAPPVVVAAAQVPDPAPAPTLPATASSLPLIALCGLLLLGGALAIKKFVL
jgi:hypothetical protein